jgi:hypothetical protein
MLGQLDFGEVSFANGLQKPVFPDVRLLAGTSRRQARRGRGTITLKKVFFSVKKRQSVH